MIKAAIFDYGGVVTRGGTHDRLPKVLAASLNISPDRAHDLLMLGMKDYQCGKINEEQFWIILEKAHGSSISNVQRDIWYHWDEIKPDPSMAGYVEGLRRRGYKTAILSNVEPHTAKMLRDHGAYAAFETIVLSCEQGYRKPSLEIYRVVLRQLGCEASECLYVDDNESLLLPAAELGMETVLAVSISQLMRDVDARLSY